MMSQIRITRFEPAYRDAIRRLNVEWLEKYFQVEEIDKEVLSHPEEVILAPGGEIFYAWYGDEIVGTVSLMKIDDTSFELTKMAVSENFQGLGIGKLLMENCLDFAKKAGIKQIIIYSNRRLERAVDMYRKFGFLEMDLGPVIYQRADIKMRLDIS
ncbi:GNAT family N-acetyltransferase [Aquirufa ecclesiirivi]|uniref:GNAT family N-acetyltransferase n=2 Tax=Aquirufa ecclesiirivi TaxID=2715124 RepID=UPI0023D83DEE|nr:GNAT family N-acetyltransferase [Aquirufa ecclesiirivi]MCZ2473250.1 GNAT family N-acetyltransferase [Aquirufa ecclesiirivi]MDF0692563.1 GNAT family N-acetyltransferase [Aquirufa ecclesiirivi]